MATMTAMVETMSAHGASGTLRRYVLPPRSCTVSIPRMGSGGSEISALTQASADSGDATWARVVLARTA
jgi:hypothetical protein